MKKYLVLLFSFILIFTLLSCTVVSETQVTEQNTTTLFGGSTDTATTIEALKDRDFDYPLLFISEENELDYMTASYTDGDVHFDFHGDNEFGDGYAIIEDATFPRGEGKYYPKDGNTSNEETIYFFNSYKFFIVSKTEEDPVANGISYDRDYHDEDRVYAYLTDDYPMQWSAEGVYVWNTETGEDDEIDGAYTEMITTYVDGKLHIEINPIGESVIESFSMDLEGEYEYFGSNSDIELRLAPHFYYIEVSITKGNQVYYFEFRDDDYYVDETMPFPQDAPPVTDLSVKYNEVEYDVPSFSWTPIGHKDHYDVILQIKIQDGTWHTLHTYRNYNYIGETVYAIEEDFITKITEARVAVFPSRTADGTHIYYEDHIPLIDDYEFVKGSNWIDCDITYNFINETEPLTITQVSDIVEHDDYYSIDYEIENLLPNSEYNFTAEGASYSSGYSRFTEDDGVFEFFNSTYDDVWDYDFSVTPSGVVVPNNGAEFFLTNLNITKSDEENGVTPYVVDKTIYSSFVLSSSYDIMNLIDEFEINAPTEFIAGEHDNNIMDITYEDSSVFVDFTGSNVFLDGYAVMDSPVLWFGNGIYYPEDGSEENPTPIYFEMDSYGYYVSFEEEIDRSVAERYSIQYKHIENIERNLIGEAGEVKTWEVMSFSQLDYETGEFTPITDVDLASISVTTTNKDIDRFTLEFSSDIEFLNYSHDVYGDYFFTRSGDIVHLDNDILTIVVQYDFAAYTLKLKNAND